MNDSMKEVYIYMLTKNKIDPWVHRGWHFYLKGLNIHRANESKYEKLIGYDCFTEEYFNNMMSK